MCAHRKNSAVDPLLRDVRPRDDHPRFEAAIGRINPIMLGHFSALVVLVRSTIGKLHATRLSDASEAVLVTTDPVEALEFLASRP